METAAVMKSRREAPGSSEVGDDVGVMSVVMIYSFVDNIVAA
jgi:hypothetical protein